MSPGIDAVIMPVVSRNTIKRGNKRVVKLGDKEIVLNAPRLHSGDDLEIYCPTHFVSKNGEIQMLQGSMVTEFGDEIF